MKKLNKYNAVSDWVDKQSGIGFETIANCWGEEEYDDRDYADWDISSIKQDMTQWAADYSSYYNEIKATEF